jgi:hypothetical protein
LFLPLVPVRGFSQFAQEIGMDKLIGRIGVALDEASTWRGFALLLTVVGVVTTPEQNDAIVAFGLGVAGLLSAFIRDKPKGE